MWWQHLCHNKAQQLPYTILHSLISQMESCMHQQKSFRKQKTSPSLQMSQKVFLMVKLVNEDIDGPLVFYRCLGESTFPTKILLSKPGSTLPQFVCHCVPDSPGVISKKGV
jgi:hypothetical protein